MKKKLLFSMMLVALGLQAQIIVADGGAENLDVPIDPYYRYTYSESIYLQSEIDTAVNIHQIGFKWNGGDSWTEPIKIYMGHTSKTEFSSNTDWVTSNNMTLVYEGNISVSSEGWVDINLDTQFNYNNIDNLVIGVDENGYDYHSTSGVFYTKSTQPTHRSIYYYSDSNNPDPSSPPTVGTNNTWYYIPSLRFNDDDPLPVELLSLKGYSEDKNNVLEWVTASELNNERFDIYTVNIDNTLKFLGFVGGNGTTTEMHQYHFTHCTQNKNSIYVIKQVDFDGTSKAFQPVSVNKRESDIITIYPNPAVDEIKINLESLMNVDIKIFDSSGKIVMENLNKRVEGTCEYNLENLKSGCYFITISNDFFKSSKKFCKTD